MGKLVDGEWITDDRIETDTSGRFQRVESQLRNWVTRDGRAGPSGQGGYKAESGRYHLYAAINCPWAHRTMIMRKLKSLESVISLSLVAPRRNEQGWVFDRSSETYRDDVLDTGALHQVYTASKPDYSGRVTVPVLWDKQGAEIVSNESSEIIRMFNDAFDPLTGNNTDYYPADLREEIDTLNARIYATVNNGVYRAGFARTQEAYDEAVTALFETLDDLDGRLATRRYLTGDRLTEADWRLFPTLVRFDVAYHGAFKCNIRRIADYAHLSGYLRELFQMPGIAETVDLEIYKRGYYSISELRNPLGIIPKGPSIDLWAPHERDAL